METLGHDLADWWASSNGKSQNCRHYSALPSNTVFCRRRVGGVTIGLPRLETATGPSQEGAMGDLSRGTPPSKRPAEDRLDSWKEIATYVKRDLTTVQRWEKREGM